VWKQATFRPTSVACGGCGLLWTTSNGRGLSSGGASGTTPRTGTSSSSLFLPPSGLHWPSGSETTKPGSSTFLVSVPCFDPFVVVTGLLTCGGRATGSLVSLGSFTYPFVAGREKRYQACVDRVDRLVYLLCVEEEEKLRREVDIAEDSSAVMDSHRRCYSKYIQAVKEYVTAPNDALPVWRY